MFDKFGEFDSAEELNKAAAGLKEEGDMTGLIELAEENGLDKADAEDYMDDMVPELATPLAASLGRISIQEAGSAKEDIMTAVTLKVIAMTLKSMVQEEAVAAAVMKKGKRIKEIYEVMKKDASKNQSGGMAVVCGTDEDLRRIIRAYFLEGREAAKNCIAELRK